MKTDRVMTSFLGRVDKRERETFVCVCVCSSTAGSESESLCITLFSYAHQLVLLFTVHKLWCMFIYVNIQCWIKASMSHNHLSGSQGRVGGGVCT